MWPSRLSGGRRSHDLEQHCAAILKIIAGHRDIALAGECLNFCVRGGLSFTR